LVSCPFKGVLKEIELAVAPAIWVLRRPGRADAAPTPGFSSYWAGPPEPPQFPTATPPAPMPSACPHAKADAARGPRDWRCGLPRPPPAAATPTPPPNCTATGSG